MSLVGSRRFVNDSVTSRGRCLRLASISRASDDGASCFERERESRGKIERERKEKKKKNKIRKGRKKETEGKRRRDREGDE